MAPVIEILPPQPIAGGGMVYTATIYGADNQRLGLRAEVSGPLRARLAAHAQKALAWAKGHVRLPQGALTDLMAGNAPDCGCDLIGETFRAATLRAADLAQELPWSGDGGLVVWDFDDWTGWEEAMLPDVALAVTDVISGCGPDSGDDAIGAVDIRALMGRPTARPQTPKVSPGVAALRTAMAAVLGLQ